MVDKKMLKLFDEMERINENKLITRVYKTDVGRSGGRRPKADEMTE